MNDAKAHIFIVDDDADMRALLGRTLEQAGYQTSSFDSAAEAISRLAIGSDSPESTGTPADLILSDICMPGMDGLELVDTLKKSSVNIPVILLTAHGSLETAVKAIRQGAHDYLVKPFKKDELLVSIEGALNFNRLTRENEILRSEVKRSWSFDNIIGKSRAIKSVFELVQRVAATNANILISGESGTGKELVACAIHNNSPRAQKPFIAINCSAIPENLLESELFGHAKGSFTGAHQTKKGLFEEAQEGTIFLDEIGDMDVSLQAKLLRVIQERRIKPVGSNAEREIDVRLIAATHKDLRAAIKEGRFREDLYYRLSVIPIELPPLRNRKEDVLLLADYFLRKHCSTHHVNVRGFTRDAQARLLANPWEGNVRELENTIERAVLLCREEVITAEDLPSVDTTPNPSSFLEDMGTEFLSLREVEKRYIAIILRKTGGKKERASHILGIDRKTLYRKEKEYGIALGSSGQEEAEAAESNESAPLDAGKADESNQSAMH